jgi:hypothetical protein
VSLKINNLTGFNSGGVYRQNLVRSNSGEVVSTTVEGSASASNLLLISLWLQVPGSVAINALTMGVAAGAANDRVRIGYASSSDPGVLRVQLGISNPTGIVNATTTETHTHNSLIHILYARSGTTHEMAVNDTIQTLSSAPTGTTNSPFDAMDDTHVGLTAEDAIYGDVWVGPEQFLDITVEANRRKFIDSSGNPVALGPTGENPTGTSPYIFMGNNMRAADWNTGTNNGTMTGFSLSGGNFTDV